MSVYHCPLCPLIFPDRSGADRHLREEHRSPAGADAPLRAELAASGGRPDWRDLERFRSSEASPSVTLLLSTAPAATMTVLDVARLRQTAERARRHLSAAFYGHGVAAVVEDRLAKAVSAAESRPTDRGVAVLVAPDLARIVSLPFGPRNRHVVADRFATRDIEYALRRYPLYRVLVLGHRPRLLEGHVHDLSEITASTGADSPRVVPIRDGTPDPDPDALVGARIRAAGPLPLVAVGDHRSLERFRLQSRHAGEVVAEVPRARFHRANVVDLVVTAIERMQYESQSRAVAELLHADMQSQVAWGAQAAWNALRNGNADRLWVEHDYAVPRRPVAGVHGVESASGPLRVDGMEDTVDALLAEAARLGIETELLDRHSLDRPEPLAVRIAFTPPLAARAQVALATA